MPSKRSPFWSPVEPISPPPKPASRSGLGWRRRVPPPGPKDLFRCPFIAIAEPCGRQLTYRGREAGREGGPGPHDVAAIRIDRRISGATDLDSLVIPWNIVGFPFDSLGFPLFSFAVLSLFNRLWRPLSENNLWSPSPPRSF